MAGGEAGEGFGEVESLPGLADPGLTPVGNVPRHTAHHSLSCLRQTLKLAAVDTVSWRVEGAPGVGVFAIVNQSSLL